MGKLPDAPPDPSESDNGHGLAVELHEGCLPHGPVPRSAPLAGVNRLGVQADVVTQLEDQGEDVLRNGVGPVDRYVRHRDVPLPRGFHVDNVEARRQDADELQLRQVLHHLFCDLGLVGQNDLGVPGALDDLLRLRPVVHGELAELLDLGPGIVPGIQLLAVQDDNAWFLNGHGSSSRVMSGGARLP